jgi:DNA-binding transcriptional LysR family regulator
LVVSLPSVAEQFKDFEPTEQRAVPVVVRNSASSQKLWQIPGTPARDLHVKPVLELPTLSMVRDAVLTGLGAAKLPHLLVAADIAAGSLVSWGLSSDRPSELWVLHPSKRLASAKIKAFMQFLEAHFPGEWI